MEGMPENFDKKEVGKEALKVIRDVLDGIIPAGEVTQTGIRNATPETVKKVLEENTVVTPIMKKSSEIADIEHKKKLGEDY